MMPRSPDLGLYIHIPFCHARCGYCDFVTFTGKEDKIDGYVGDLCREIGLYGGKSPHTPLLQRGDSGGISISTIFFGGGTPSVLEPRHLSQIFAAIRSHFKLKPNAEITLEANPESITPGKAKSWKDSGINRLSIGLQAYDDALLKSMGRLHNVQQFEAAYRVVRAAGFDNVSFDLIYGFPEQTLESWQNTVRSAAALAPEHLSLYSLTVEEHTPFAAAGIQVDADLQADMYDWARKYLQTTGFEQYEISNFARAGKACRHNLIYWRKQDYLGLGAGAIGCKGNLRWTNQKTLPAYHEDIHAGRLPRLSIETLDPDTHRFEKLMLGLRLREGFAWGEENNAAWLASRSTLHKQGLLEEIQPGRWRIPDAVVPLTNQILLPFL